MVGLDTNIVVRYIMQDDLRQSALAGQLMDSLTPASPGYISLICLAELYWLLDHSYKLTRLQIQQILYSLMTTKTILVENVQVAGRAFHSFAAGNADFDDCLIAQCGKASGCSAVMTFDKSAAKSAGMTLLTQSQA